ncbi:NfeD family protein [Mesorhizobium sp. M1A.F.Ca.IN.022.07.1.1]|uniref:NfeD family protein n=1 Tax=unclassified Mesorhizobium TaxID=325217 RepID=UPI000FCC8215|nr:MULTISPECIES: NfeD family protein [unclassified Mesorhizobium]RUV90416.1 NfeD family protein [Mesorhizobium sp. M1A.F.Ca.IN.022.07.1.1]RUW51161.1 NfeD family protein [Mesorhizobium sp. M1A.F.Ca.ET.072.01.1.1]RWG06921.1 MAG: NfeD family protein [Mesorhizobium sp.]RWG93784.1 MAG: NfeD family protein [Mesorhizobium sp.]TIR90140.1 MAG: NfeD family protein [Mesorhizobium sp.]
MIERIVSELGPWNWMVLGFVLLVMEIVAPGVFMLWIGIAALIIGAVSLLIWDAAFWTWQLQVLAFLVLSLASAFVGKKLVGDRAVNADQPLLNRRGAQMVGRTATLAEPIKNGRGRIRLGDTLWRVSGPDLPVGTQVRVTGAADTDLELTVEAV